MTEAVTGTLSRSRARSSVSGHSVLINDHIPQMLSQVWRSRWLFSLNYHEVYLLMTDMELKRLRWQIRNWNRINNTLFTHEYNAVSHFENSRWKETEREFFFIRRKDIYVTQFWQTEAREVRADVWKKGQHKSTQCGEAAGRYLVQRWGD